MTVCPPEGAVGQRAQGGLRQGGQGENLGPAEHQARVDRRPPVEVLRAGRRSRSPAWGRGQDALCSSG